MGFTIGPPTKEQPVRGLRGKYTDIYSEVQKLKDGLWLPIVCETDDEARKLKMSLAWGLSRGRRMFESVKSGLTVHVRPVQTKAQKKS